MPQVPDTSLEASLKKPMLHSTTMVPDSRRVSPTLDASMASGGGVHGDTLGCRYFPKGVAEESPATRHLLPLAPLHVVWLPPLVDPIVLLVEFLVVPVCAYALPCNGRSVL
jgi:hypothetical protein